MNGGGCDADAVSALDTAQNMVAPLVDPLASGMGGVRFAGYAALFDREDRGGDIIRRGAFTRAIANWRAGGLPLLWQHRPAGLIGHIDMLAEDDRGLRVIGRLHDDADEAISALKARRVGGLSFGYRVMRADGHAPRVLKDLDLIEVSLVTRPMQPGARVHALA